jgi:hypothetical protein
MFDCITCSAYVKMAVAHRDSRLSCFGAVIGPVNETVCLSLNGNSEIISLFLISVAIIMLHLSEGLLKYSVRL